MFADACLEERVGLCKKRAGKTSNKNRLNIYIFIYLYWEEKGK